MDVEFNEYLNPRYIACAMIESQSIDFECLVKWADRLIVILNSPPEWLFSISLGRNLKAIDDSIRKSLADENLLDHHLIDTLFIGFSYCKFKNKKITLAKFEDLLVGYFVGSKLLFNEDDLIFYFSNINSNYEVVSEINLEFEKSENISKRAEEFFWGKEIITYFHFKP